MSEKSLPIQKIFDQTLETLAPLTQQLDPFGIYQSIFTVQQAWLNAPEAWMNAVREFWDNYCHVCGDLGDHNTGSHSHTLRLPNNDSRFIDPAWDEHPFYHSVKQQYQLWEKWLDHTIKKSPEVDEDTRNKARFWIKQYTHMLSPSNFFFLNPEAIAKAIATQGQSLIQGQKLFLHDAKTQEISMVSPNFTVGKNLATTPGTVIYRNPLLELIYYTPTTNEVLKTPLLFVPPWINKYYILDLKADKSPVRYLLNQGFSVFMISWKNPSPEMRNVSFEDYLLKGILPAIEVVKNICGVSAIHAIGYCIGGTALATLMAWLNAHPDYRDLNPIAHATLLCSLIDFSNPGEIKVFIDENSVSYLENMVDTQGVLDGKQMETAFRLLRSNSLIWHYFSTQYLMGEAPSAFDILYWNTDGTRLPAAMYKTYLRQLYLNNKLVKKNAFTIGNIGIDLSLITQSLYLLGAEVDHITPWKSVFSLPKHCPLADVRGVLAASGHIAGVLTPPSNPPKRYYRAGPLSMHDSNHEEWMKALSPIDGSWWLDWVKWLQERCGDTTSPPSSAAFKDYPSLGKAPGKYVLE
jgi:polyhydroxyalkanoate synthase